jgi:alginate O-acetyltransferase complex protein AlgI
LEFLSRKLITFDFFYSIPFWAVFAAVVVVFRLLNRNRKLAGCFMLVISIVMILAIPRVTVLDMVFLFALSCAVFLAGKALCGMPLFNNKPYRVTLSAVTVVLVAAILVFFKYKFIQDLAIKRNGFFLYGIKDYLFIIGISYYSFRMIHFTIECHRNKISQVDALSFMNYIFFFPAFISGPIHRYDDFQKQWSHIGNSGLVRDLKDGLFRIVNGLFKKLVLAEVIYAYSLTKVMESNGYTLWQVILGIYCSTLYFYFDFSGYSDLAIGSARLLGIELPENFKQPFLKPNIQQLWANWHMSLTTWLQDYVYWPLVRRLRGIALFREHPVLLSNVCIVVTFAVCGMWHGESINFLIWGVYHGLGIAAMNVYKSRKKRVRNPWLKRYFFSPESRILGIVLSVNYFAFGIVIFSLNLQQLKLLLSNI